MEFGTQAADHPCPDGLRHPTGLAVDSRDRLYVVETVGRAVLVCDLWSGRALRRVPTVGTPVDVVVSGARAWVLTRRPATLVLLEGRVGPRPGAVLLPPLCRSGVVPARVTLLGGSPLVLWLDGDEGFVCETDGSVVLEVENAYDIAGTIEGILVVGRRPGMSFLRFRRDGNDLVEEEPLAAPSYDGGAVGFDPNGRVAYTTLAGRRSTQGSSAHHKRRGLVTTYRLDSGSYRTRWGRVFLAARLPTGTSVRVRCLTSDEDTVADPIPASPPTRGGRDVPEPDQTPPLPSTAALEDDGVDVEVVRRPSSPTASPTVSASDDTTYECPVAAPPGRYLWLRLELTGTEHTSPQLTSIQVERPGHQLMTSLPRSWSGVESDAEFLHRFLTPPEGVLHDLDTAAAERSVLVDPRTTPGDALPWLASFAGLVLDARWPEQARRRLVAQAYQLYARRGTLSVLEQILTLYLGRQARIVERWRLRGLGGAVLSLEPQGLDAPTVGGNTRAAGMLGHFTVGGETASTSSYRRFAHRFTVLVQGRLTEEQRVVVGSIVERHKPAHTAVNVCELGNGLPVGRLRIGLTAYVGPPPRRPSAVLGQSEVGRDATVGSQLCGARVDETRIGRVRVG
jgi:phage tail-like protein